ncbi:MAG: hypothetical protein ACXWLH_06375, partial [Candidatus Saccharimonadales bacterium]
MVLLEAKSDSALIDEEQWLRTTLTPEVSEALQDRDLALRAMDRLSVREGSELRFEAAEPGYLSSFTRDTLIALSLRGDA